MQLSRYVVRYDDLRPGEHVLYSVLHDRYVGIDDSTRESIERWTSGAWPRTAEEREVALALVEEGFVVQDRAEDDAALRAHLDRAREGMPGTMMVTLMPTLQCNLACGYCFQKESPAFTKMDGEGEEATLEWMLRAVDERGLHTLHVHYFGGEPLTRKDFCLRTAEVLHAAMAARGGRFEWSMTTNGVLLDLPFVRQMNRFGQGSIKVTLDGDRETHDQARTFRDGRGSFDRIFANVVACAPHVRLRIGGNFLPGQGESYERLLERLEAAGLGGKLAEVRFKPRIDVERKDGCAGCSHAASEAEVRTLVQLNAAVGKRRLGPVQGEVLEAMLGPCELHWRNNYTIDPEGNVYKCPAVAGRPEMAVDQVRSRPAPGAPRAEKPAPLLQLRPWEKCGDCAYLPVCVGGCLGSKWLETGRVDLVACKQDSFAAAFRETVVQRYLAEFTAPEDGWQRAAG